MNKENAKDFLPIIKAYSEGKIIQIYKYDTKTWIDVKDNQSLAFSEPIEEYRIKPTPVEANTIITEFKHDIYSNGYLEFHINLKNISDSNHIKIVNSFENKNLQALISDVFIKFVEGK
jgi:hypothetical protein